MEDAGSYVCTAENAYGVDEVTAQLKITGLGKLWVIYMTLSCYLYLKFNVFLLVR